MGFYIRKSFSFGPLRLNLSKSGIGYSFGVKGARIGTGRRGNYIHMGRYGLYYRQQLSGPPRQALDRPTPIEPQLPVLPGTMIPTADVTALKDSSAEDLLDYIRCQHEKIAVAPWFSVLAGLVVVWMFMVQVRPWLAGVCLVLVPISFGVLKQFDSGRKRVILKYHLEDVAKSRYQLMVEGIKALASSKRVWRVVTSDRSYDLKYTAGAGQLINRKPISAGNCLPPFFQANIPVWRIALGNQNAYFLPDRVLVYQGAQVGAVSYSDLSAGHSTTRFVEEGGVPGDARTVGTTWRYVNKGGGPDRRFSNNKQIPVAEYSEVFLQSTTGFNVLLQCSNVERARIFVDSLKTYSTNLTPAKNSNTELPYTLDAEPLKEKSLLEACGWLAIPVLLFLFSGVLLFGPRDRYLETPSPQLSITETNKQLPQVKILRQTGTQISVAVPSDTSDLELQRIVTDLRKKIAHSQLPELGITITKQLTSSGSINIYRTDKEKVVPKAKSDAIIKWVNKTTTATLKDATGRQVPML